MKPIAGLLIVIVALVAVDCCARAATAQESLTYVDLVKRMIDLEHLAVLPQPGETCKQWSSYDRASRYDEATGKYVDWGANGDDRHMLRREGDSSVMGEMQGPGCIWRIWSARSERGHVKIYLDGQSEPTIDLPFDDYFTGKTPPFNYPALSYHNADQGSLGEDLYFPIPYQKSCKIVAEKGWGSYYHIDYVTYPKGTKVPTFKTDLSAEEVAALKEVNDFFQNRLGTDPAGQREDEEVIAESVSLPAGGHESLEIPGPAAITALKGSAGFKDREDEMAALREMVLKITFDGAEEPAVWSPLGDFFGTAPGVNLYKSLPTGMTEQGAYAYWYMPFAESALLELCNEGQVDRDLDVTIVHAPLSRPFAGLGHFHAKWHRDIFPVSKDRWPDWTILRTQGSGRFCGVMLHVWNPRGGWWGEGDEKFFVDGEKFPSTIGTGSEDYFGYAWCHPGLFQHAYHCQTMTQNNKGHQSVLRWHIVDNIPFHTSFEACIEKYYPNEQGTLYACLPCWYLSPSGVDPIEPTPVKDRHGYYTRLPITASGFKVVGQPNGEVQNQDLSGFGQGKWNNDDQLWWTGAKPGDKLDLVLNVENSGTYDVTVKLTKAPDYGIVQLYVDGKKAAEPIDLYLDQVVPSGPISLGAFQLNKGDHKLTVEIVGANGQAVKSYMFGLDCVILKEKK